MILKAVQSVAVAPHEFLARVIGMTRMHIWVKKVVSHDALHPKGLYTSGRQQYYKCLRILQACCTPSNCEGTSYRDGGHILLACLHEGTFFLPFSLQLNMLHIWTLPHTSCQFVCIPVIMQPGTGPPLPSPPLLSPHEGTRKVCVQVTLYPPGAGLGSAPIAMANERSPAGKASKRKRGGARARQK